MEETKITAAEMNEEELTNVSGGAYVGPCIVYTIQRGDTLSKIAARYGTTVNILVELNHIANKNRIYAGHKLLIPAR